jgi:acetyl-CoA synthetase
MMIANYSSMPVHPGSMGQPIPGIKAGILDDKYTELPPEQEGQLAIKP